MLDCHFEVLRCSWPRPTCIEDQQWIIDPEWSAPVMPLQPDCSLEYQDDQWRWTIHWSHLLHATLRTSQVIERDFRNFHLVWQLKIKNTGTLRCLGVGCHIRRAGILLYQQRSLLPAQPVSLSVSAGDVLEIAQVHGQGTWSWWACEDTNDPIETFFPYLKRVQAALHLVNGPALKIYSDGRALLRLAAGVYSMILNGGYRPEQILLFGEHQWSPGIRAGIQRLLPFARIVETSAVLKQLANMGGETLVSYAQRSWAVMKLGTLLFLPPYTFCGMDDDVLILQSVADALQAFEKHHLVALPDMDYEDVYTSAWQEIFPDTPRPLPTARLNIGLFWLRNQRDLSVLVKDFLRMGPRAPLIWEQGFVAMAYAHESVHLLPRQRYISPILDGLPGGLMGYDYARNPCDFTCLHLCGLPGAYRLSNGQVLSLLPALLAERKGHERALSL